MRNLSPWTAVASVVFAAAASTALAAYEPAQPRTSEGTQTPKMQGVDNGAPSDSATPTMPSSRGDTMTPDRSTPDEHHDDGDLNSGASPSPQELGPRAAPSEQLRHLWPDNGAAGTQEPSDGAGDRSPQAGDQGTTDSQRAKPDNPASPFSPVNPAAPALKDPQGGDPTNPVTPASMRYMIIA